MRSQLAQMHIRCDELQVPSYSGTAAMPGLSGSASLNGKTVTVTITNPSLDSTVAARIRLTSGSIVEGRGKILTHADMTAGNTFDHPDKVKLMPFPVAVRGGKAEVSLPPRAVVSLELVGS
jgi:alpha-L-arabinofuranosidase